MNASKVFKCIGIAILGLAFIALLIFVTMSLWNWLIPDLFHGPVLTFCQTAGLLVLSKILLSGFHHHGRRHHPHNHPHQEGEGCCDNRWWKKFHHHSACCNQEKGTETK